MAASSSAFVAKYPYPLGINVGDSVPIKLSKTNYFIWKTLMLRFIEKQGLDGFINGNILAPPERIVVLADITNNVTEEIKNRDYQDWERTDELLRRWIIGTTNEDVLPHVVRLKTAKDMWTRLERCSSQHFLHETLSVPNIEAGTDLIRYLPLHKYALTGDWQSAQGFFEQERDAVKAIITGSSETALMLAVRSEQGNNFVSNLLLLMTPEDVALRDCFGSTALHIAAAAGNVEAAKLLVGKNQDLPNKWDGSMSLPLHRAAVCGRKKMVLYLLDNTREDIEPKPFADEPGAKLVNDLIANGLYDTALSLVERYPELVSVDPSPLESLVLKRSAFPSGTSLNWMQRLVYPHAPDHPGREDNENPDHSHRRDNQNLLSYIISGLQVLPYFRRGAPDHPARGDNENPDYSHRRDNQNLLSDAPTNLEDSANHPDRRDIENPDHPRRRGRWNLANYLWFPFRIVFQIAVWFPFRIVFQIAAGPVAYTTIEAIFELVVWEIKLIGKKKLIHKQAFLLVKHLCMEVAKLEYSKASRIFGSTILMAACVGTREIVEEILVSFPSAIYAKNEMNRNIFHLAIVNRRESVFNLIYQFRKELRHIFLTEPDILMNNGLHLAGCLENEQKLNLRAGASGAALQMQHELQWFREVEKVSLPQDKEHRNMEGKTPAMVFTETHEDLVKEGEQWMKGMASSCTIVAALLVTIVFTASMKVTSGNNDNNGLPILYKTKALRIFAISDALALYASTSSVLVFLTIHTSRYAQDDFLFALPIRLMIGLVTLFLSIIFTLIAFGATVYLMFGEKKSWILILVISCSIPVILFAYAEFLLHLNVLRSTIGPGIFVKQGRRILF